MYRFIKKIHQENGKKEECLRCPRHSQWYRRGVKSGAIAMSLPDDY